MLPVYLNHSITLLLTAKIRKKIATRIKKKEISLPFIMFYLKLVGFSGYANGCMNGYATVQKTPVPVAPSKPEISTFDNIALSFSWYTNLRTVFNLNPRPGTLLPICGLRFAIIWLCLVNTWDEWDTVLKKYYEHCDDVLYFSRLYATTFVIVSHSFLFAMDFYDNKVYAFNITESLLGQFFINSSFATDAFFCIRWVNNKIWNRHANEISFCIH